LTQKQSKNQRTNRLRLRSQGPSGSTPSWYKKQRLFLFFHPILVGRGR